MREISTDFLKHQNAAQDHHHGSHSPTNGENENPAIPKANTDQDDTKQNQKNHGNKYYIHLSNAYSIYSAVMCAFTGSTGILVFGATYTLVRLFLMWGLKRNNLYSHGTPKALNEAIQSRLPLSIIAAISGICTYRLSELGPDFVEITVTISEATLMIVATSAIMSAVGDTVAFFLHRQAQKDGRTV